MNKFLIIAFTLLCTGWAVNAQNITIKGQVLDNLKEPVPMANISQVGTTNGTISDIDGNYTISVPVRWSSHSLGLSPKGEQWGKG